jgi:hypothetical protein
VGHIVQSGASMGMKCRCTIFHARVGRCGFHKKGVGTRYVEPVFLHPVGSVGHVVHSGVFGARNIDALLFMLGWLVVVSIKSMLGHVSPNFCFCIRWDLWVT